MKIKDMDGYLGEKYSDNCQPDIMTETQYTFPNPEILTIIPDMGIECPKTDVYMTYL